VPDTLSLRNSLVVLPRILLYCYKPVTVAFMYAHANKAILRVGQSIPTVPKKNNSYLLSLTRGNKECSLSLAGLLPKHFVRILVFPDSEKDWLTEPIIPRPFGEFYLTDHHRFNPMAALHFGTSQPLVPAASPGCREVKKGTVFGPKFV
jgi:hypothetical protein